MRVFLDTNVLLSAALWPNGVASACYVWVVTHEHEVVVSDYVLGELHEVTRRKFATRSGPVEAWLATLLQVAAVVATPEGPVDDEDSVRDHADRPVLRAARSAGCDLLITGDKDLLEARIATPDVLTPGECPGSICSGLTGRAPSRVSR